MQGLWEEPLAEGGAGAKLGKERAWVEEEDRRRERERDEELGELAERILFQVSSALGRFGLVLARSLSSRGGGVAADELLASLGSSDSLARGKTT